MRHVGWLVGALFCSVGALAACSSDPPSDPGDGGAPETGGATATGGRGSGGRGSGGRATGGAKSTGGRASGGAATGGSAEDGGASSSGGSGDGGSEGSGGSGDGGAVGSGGSGGEPDASPCPACPSGACLGDGTCVDCTSSAQCQGELAHCSPSNTCVQCIPGDTDDCADGSYCDVDFACKPGCKTSADCGPGICLPAHTCTDCNPDGPDGCPTGRYCKPDASCAPGCKPDGDGCASGVCLSNHECSSCIADAECQSPRKCATGTCADPCETSGDCQSIGGAECCTDRCAVVARDHKACLACGNVCSDTQFCSATGCLDGTIARVCDSSVATVLLDGLEVDDRLAPVLSAGLAAGCPTAINVRTLPQTTAGTLNGTTGQPVVGSGDMQVVIGGPYGQNLIRYLDNQGITHVYNSSNGERLRFQLRNATESVYIVDLPHSAVGPTHDYFLIETVVDPPTGTLMFAIHGFFSHGTLAGTWLFLNHMLPSRSTFTKSWYVYEWTNADADPEGSAGDTYALLASGI